LKKDVVVLFGLRYMFEVSWEGKLRLWFDVYAPLWSISEKRPLHRKEIDSELKELYVQKALLRPKHRYTKTLELIKTIFEDKSIKLEFCDGDHFSFPKEMYKISHSMEETQHGDSFSYIRIEEPYLKFKLASSKNPRSITRLKAYGYGTSIKDLHIKAILYESAKEAFLSFFQKLRNGFSGSYMYWPGFQTVTGVNLFFDEEHDVRYLDDLSEEVIRECLLQVFSESYDKTVTLLVVPELPHGFYYKIKALALQKGKPLQIILTKTLEKEPLEFTLMNIGVAMYAKGGGIPWIPASPLTQTRSLFIGISFHVDHELKDIYYGVMEVFDKFGRHLECKIRMYSSPTEIKSVRGLYIPEDDAERILIDLVKEYNPHEIIFHKSAPFHKEEEKAIENMCKEEEIAYCLVHIERANPYRIYMEEDNFTPIRGTIVFDMYDRNRAILNTTGQTILDLGKIRPWSGIGTPRPLEIKLEKNTTKHNLREIAEQILTLTKLDWNTTEILVKSPITLKYSNKAANLAPYLRGEVGKGPIEVADIRFLM
jgi:hypothetical protein